MESYPFSLLFCIQRYGVLTTIPYSLLLDILATFSPSLVCTIPTSLLATLFSFLFCDKSLLVFDFVPLDFTLKYVQDDGLNRPIVFRDPSGLGMR